MSKRFMIIVLALTAGLILLIAFTKKDANAPETQAGATNHTQGAGTSGVTLVEYGDLQCPACGGYYPILKQVKDKYGDQITFQFRHFPLVSLHRNAMAAHRAAEAAAKQDKFWEMHDMMYERQAAWSQSNSVATVFEGYARELGLDVEQFKTDVASAEVQALINADIKEGQALNITATPGFVLNGKKLEDNPRGDLDSFSALIDEAITEQAQQQ